MITETIDFMGEACLFDRSGALFLVQHECLVVADLHFEKGSSFVGQGLHLPPYDTRATLNSLQEAIGRLRPKSIVALGDSFHDRAARSRLDDNDARQIRSLTDVHDWTWIIGNHDPDPPSDLGGTVADIKKIGALTLVHEPLTSAPLGEVIGHYHPCAAFRAKGRRLRRRCFVTDGRRLILPSFGSYTGGLNVRDQVYDALFIGEIDVWMLGREGVYRVAHRKLLPDAGQKIRLQRHG